MRKGLEYREAESVASARKSRCSLPIARRVYACRGDEFRSRGKTWLRAFFLFFFVTALAMLFPRSDVRQENKLLSTSSLYGVYKYSSANPIGPASLLHVTRGHKKAKKRYPFVHRASQSIRGVARF